MSSGDLPEPVISGYVLLPAPVVHEVLNGLGRADCAFWVCKGPRLTPIEMVTCSRCRAIAALRHALGLPIED